MNTSPAPADGNRARDIISRLRPRNPKSLAEPTIAEITANFTGAMARWAAAGFKTVSAETYAARATVCEACEFWDSSARFRLGMCRARGYGCTKFKRFLASEQCPLEKWPV